MDLENLLIRSFEPTDSIEALTLLLHRAYSDLGRQGMRYLATHQTEEQTRERLESGDPFVSLLNNRLVGTITLYTEHHGKNTPEIYRRDDVGWFGQFGVEPELQGKGIGQKMLTFVEEHARARGLSQLALDTSENAVRLIRWYEKNGWEIVDHTQWDDTNYRSVIMSKPLS